MKFIKLFLKTLFNKIMNSKKKIKSVKNATVSRLMMEKGDFLICNLLGFENNPITGQNQNRMSKHVVLQELLPESYEEKGKVFASAHSNLMNALEGCKIGELLQVTYMGFREYPDEATGEQKKYHLYDVQIIEFEEVEEDEPEDVNKEEEEEEEDID